jgi:hypothetical protein
MYKKPNLLIVEASNSEMKQYCPFCLLIKSKKPILPENLILLNFDLFLAQCWNLQTF